MNATVKMVAVIGLVLIAGFACGYLFAGATAPVPQAKAIIVEVIAYSSEPIGGGIVYDQDYIVQMDKDQIQFGVDIPFVKENHVGSWAIKLHNI